MNASQCSFLLLSLLPHVQDNFSELKFVVLSTAITSILTAFGIFANASFIFVMLWERIKHLISDCLKDKPNSGNTARARITKNKNRSNNEIPRLLMISLAFNDLIYSCFISPLGVSDNMENGVWIFGRNACYARILLVYYQLGVSICHINSMAIDRFIAICKPLVYRLLTNKSGYILIGFSWSFPAVMQLIPHVLDWAQIEDNKMFECTGKECAEIYSTTTFIVLIVLGFCIPFFTPYCFYVFILKEVVLFNRRRSKLHGKDQQENITTFQKSLNKDKNGHNINGLELKSKHSTFPDEKLKTSLNVDTNTVGKPDKTKPAHQNFKNRDVFLPNMESISSKHHISKVSNLKLKNSVLQTRETIEVSSRPRETNMTNRNMKAYRTVGAIIICFSLCWCPVWIIFIQFFNARDPIPPWFNVLISTLSNMNPALNPFLYCFNRPVRQAIKSFLFLM